MFNVLTSWCMRFAPGGQKFKRQFYKKKKKTYVYAV